MVKKILNFNHYLNFMKKIYYKIAIFTISSICSMGGAKWDKED